MLGPKDPEGYYVVLLKKQCIDRIKIEGEDKIEQLGDTIIFKTRSRRKALKVLRMKDCVI